MEQGSRPARGIYAVVTAGVIMAVFFLLVIFGSAAYRGTVAAQEKNNRGRALISYIMTAVKSGDAEGAVRVYAVDGAPVVSVEEADSGYGIRIYQHEGRLMGDYGKLDQALNPKGALAVGETEIFQVENLGNDVYRVTTDAGRALFHLRCGTD